MLTDKCSIFLFKLNKYNFVQIFFIIPIKYPNIMNVLHGTLADFITGLTTKVNLFHFIFADVLWVAFSIPSF
jgi:hypothetical protein